MTKCKRLIDAVRLERILRRYEELIRGLGRKKAADAVKAVIKGLALEPTVDAVEVETIEAWLYQIAMNNTDNTLCGACEEIIRRLDGLRVFARERRDNG